MYLKKRDGEPEKCLEARYDQTHQRRPLIVVADASAIAQILLNEKKAQTFGRLLAQADLVVAPDLFVNELSNTLWKYCVAGRYNGRECLKLISDGLGYIHWVVDTESIVQEAFDEGVRHHHPVYDMFYMVTARRCCGTLITNDSDLAKLCKKLHIGVCF